MDNENKQFGAGGTSGGIGTFLLGFLMLCCGIYLLLNNIVVSNNWAGFGVSFFHMGTFNVTSGTILLPIIFGIGIVFYNGKSLLGWLLCGGGLAALVAGVIMNTHIYFKSTSLFDTLCIFILAVGGLGLILKSIRPESK